MDLGFIQERMDRLVQPMLDRGLYQAEAAFHVTSNTTSSAYLRWAESSDQKWPDKSQYFRGGDDPFELIEVVQAWVESQPLIAERERALFMTKLADTIETGKRIGVDVQFLNPLTEAMKRLSENAITDQSETNEDLIP